MIKAIERLLSLQDRDQASPTYGCFDRSFWSWKYKDLPDATFQNGVYALTLAWKHRHPQNPYFHQRRILKWIEAGLEYWIKSQYSNGSFDQIYPHENSYGATGFTLFYMLETYQLLKKHLNTRLKKRLNKSFKAAADFLISHRETHGLISNHLCAAAAALYRYSQLSRNQKTKQRAQRIITDLLGELNEGWLPEYGGADPGYQSLALFYLTHYYQMSRDKKVEKALDSMVHFLTYFFHPDGTFGGEYGSRNTEIFYPGGIALLGKKVDYSPQLHLIDEPNLTPLLINYLTDFFTQKKRAALSPAWKRSPFKKYFPQAGIYIVNTASYYAIVNLLKGGMVKVFSKKKRQLIFPGGTYLGVLASPEKLRFISSQPTSQKPQFTLSNAQKTIKIESPFRFFSLPTQTPGLIFLLRAFNLSLGRISFINTWLKDFLVKTLIMSRQRAPLKLERQISFRLRSVRITDTIKPLSKINLIELSVNNRHRTFHMGSSRYFQANQLASFEVHLDTRSLNRQSSLKKEWNIIP